MLPALAAAATAGGEYIGEVAVAEVVTDTAADTAVNAVAEKATENAQAKNFTAGQILGAEVNSFVASFQQSLHGNNAGAQIENAFQTLGNAGISNFMSKRKSSQIKQNSVV